MYSSQYTPPHRAAAAASTSKSSGMSGSARGRMLAASSRLSSSVSATGEGALTVCRCYAISHAPCAFCIFNVREDLCMCSSQAGSKVACASCRMLQLTKLAREVPPKCELCKRVCCNTTLDTMMPDRMPGRPGSHRRLRCMHVRHVLQPTSVKFVQSQMFATANKPSRLSFRSGGNPAWWSPPAHGLQCWSANGLAHRL